MILFGRAWFLSVGNLDLSDIDLIFKVERSTRREPNTAEIQIFNLNDTSRASIERGAAIRLRAGYGANPSQIVRGDVRDVWTVGDQVDRTTFVTSRDGGTAYAEAPISRAYGPGTRCGQVLRDVVSALGIGEGNLSEFEAAFQLRTGASTFADGYVAHGRASRILNDLLRGAGLRWSVQNGALQILRSGAPLQTQEIVLSSDTGLVGSPTWDDQGHRTGGARGVVSAKCLIQPGVEPGRKVRIESRDITGDFEVRKVAYNGDTRGQDWYATIEGRPCH